jgi:hypothetical protein
MARKITEADAVGSASGTDVLPADRAGSAIKITINQMRAGLVPETRTIGTQHSITGGGDLSGDRTLNLVNDTASPGNNMLYGTNGSGVRGWYSIPAGGAVAYGDLTGIPAAIDAIDGLTPAADRVAYYTGASTAALATLTGFARTLLDDADAATARATLGITDGPSLAANQFTARNNANDGFEARTEKVVGSVFLPITGNVSGGAAEGQIGMWGNKPTTLTAVRARTLGGTCSIQIRKNGSPINGFSGAVSQTTSVTNTASTEALAQDNLLDVVVTNATGLTGLFITFLGTRTGN